MLVVGRQHALIKKCALNNEVRLITQVYGIRKIVFYEKKAMTRALMPLRMNAWWAAGGLDEAIFI